MKKRLEKSILVGSRRGALRLSLVGHPVVLSIAGVSGLRCFCPLVSTSRHNEPDVPISGIRLFWHLLAKSYATHSVPAFSL
jgi:hypothetical protein